MSERRGVTFERLARMKEEYATDDDVLDVVAAVEGLDTEAQSLRRWKAEAMTVMEGLQELGRALDLAPGTRISGTSALLAVGRLKDELRAIVKERNTWARQLADANDETAAARQETDKARELAAIASNDRDNLHITMERLADTWEADKTVPAKYVNQLRRAIARWETT